MMDDDYEELMMMTGPTCFFSHAGRWNLRDAGKNCDPQNLHGTALLAARGLNMINQTVTEASESGMCGRLLLEKWADMAKKKEFRGQDTRNSLKTRSQSREPLG
jgi:hypothetical protein